ncbi:MAG: ABC transporter permease, partial [Armatimonadota bacterium]
MAQPSNNACLKRILPPTQLSLAFPIAIGFAFLVFWFLERTVPGFSIKAVGLNPEASESRGIP